MELQMGEKRKRLEEQIQEESKYLKKIKKELESEKIREKDLKKKKGEDAARILEENARADRIRE